MSAGNFTEYRMEIGTLRMGGPNVHAYGSFSCIMGESCAITIFGVDLEGANRVLILAENQTCGFSSTRAPVQGALWTNP